MDKLKIIFNGNPDSGVGNVIRSGMAVIIPMMIGLGGAVVQNLTHPELGIIPPSNNVGANGDWNSRNVSPV